VNWVDAQGLGSTTIPTPGGGSINVNLNPTYSGNVTMEDGVMLTSKPLGPCNPDPRKNYSTEEMSAALDALQTSQNLMNYYQQGKTLDQYQSDTGAQTVGNGGQITNSAPIANLPSCVQNAYSSVETGFGTYVNAAKLAAVTIVGAVADHDRDITNITGNENAKIEAERQLKLCREIYSLCGCPNG
jgi:hypothetical protein